MVHGVLSILTLALTASDSIPVVDTAHVYARRLDFAALGRHRWELPRSEFALGLNQALAAQGVFIRQYGFSGMGTISRRGADPSQVLILWNGLAVNSPMLGMSDLSLLQAFGQTEISFTEGGNSAFYGSGSVGGTLSVHTAQRSDTGFLVHSGLSAGSFGQYGVAAETGRRSNGKFWNINLTGQTAGNRFPYRLGPADREQFTMEQADFSSGGIRGSAGTNWRKWSMAAHVEWQQAERGLGVSAATVTPQGRQSDKSLRAVAEAVYRHRDLRWVNRAGVVGDRFRYLNSLSHTDDTSHSLNRQWQSELYFGRRIKGVLGADLSWISGFSDAYGGTRSRVYPAQFLSVAWPFSKTVYSANLRWEWYERMPSGSASMEWRPAKTIKISANVNSSFRRPTLNDLFWAGGGNAELKNETGAGAEAGIRYAPSSKKVLAELSLTAWGRYLNSPIVWLPDQMVWKAVNLERGDYKGIQWMSRLQTLKGRIHWHAQARVDYTHAMISDKSRRYAQIFVPAWNGQLAAGAEAKGWRINAALIYTGKRYISTDNQQILPAYMLPEIQAGRQWKLKDMDLSLMLCSENITGTVYQSMPGRPMPMRTLQVRAYVRFRK